MVKVSFFRFRVTNSRLKNKKLHLELLTRGCTFMFSLSVTNVSSNINEVIKAVLNSLFFYQTISNKLKGLKSTKSNKSTKSTKRHKDTRAKAQQPK